MKKHLFLSVPQCFYGDEERGWDRWRRCHGDRQGVHACVCTHVNERARYPARPGSQPCVLPPEAFGTSQAALFLSPTAKRERERESKVNDRKGGKKSDSWRISLYGKENQCPIQHISSAATCGTTSAQKGCETFMFAPKASVSFKVA